jgi:hypothetical protein
MRLAKTTLETMNPVNLHVFSGAILQNNNNWPVWLDIMIAKNTGCDTQCHSGISPELVSDYDAS